MNDQRDLEALLASRFPLVVIESNEELRARQMLARISRDRKWPLWYWSVSEGLHAAGREAANAQTREPTAALREIQDSGPAGLYILLDFHPYMESPVNSRLLKEIALEHERIARTVVMIGFEVKLPPDLDKLAARFRLSLPDAEALKGIIRDEVHAWQVARGGQEVKGERDAFELLVRHLSGLTESDVRRLIRHTLDDGLLDASDVQKLIGHKHELLGKDSVLTFELDTARFSDVAGLATLKRWLERRREAFLGDAAALGVDPPKGIMLLGVQGCGKSLAAKAVAGAWGTPLMRLDFGALYNKFLGETERNLREALRVADAMAPCVLWMDEIEKGVATNDNDGGESRRILGTLLTWMAERKSKVFVVATSNDIEALPPELVRKGRLDEIFFVDLPDDTARGEILKIHLKRRKQDPAGFDLPALVAASQGFSGSELEQMVVAGLYEARAAGVPLANEHLLAEAKVTKPLSVVMAEKIAWLRAWAQNRTVRAD
ncbi:MAG TPA: AAA family ATPase [Burkholderiales bacterium]|nr:AAA family ATPase [Burkholderiales bacterium]